MILLAALLASTFSEFPEWEGEFTPIEDLIQEAETPPEDVASPVLWSIIAEQENRDQLLSLVGESQEPGYLAQPELEELLKSLIDPGAHVIDFGMGLSVFLSHHIGQEGELYVFESRPESFAQRFWQLNQCAVAQAQLYFVEPQKEGGLDLLPIDSTSLLCISAGGRENVVLHGAKKLIQRDRPILLIHLIGGMVTDQLDRFIKEELERRVEEVEKMGYHLRCIEGDLYLGLPL